MDHIIKAWEHRTGNDISNYLYLFALYALRSDKATFCKAQITEGCNPFLGGSTITTLDPSSQWTGSWYDDEGSKWILIIWDVTIVENTSLVTYNWSISVVPSYGTTQVWGKSACWFFKRHFWQFVNLNTFHRPGSKKKSWNTWIKEAWHLEGYAKSKHGHAQPRLTQKYFSRLETTGLLNQAHMF